ncbi:MAG: glutathione S-transferase N-terminal domain-containing protein [Proteobacteria bacterium]|nr:glutathione S-transferase N-terminal domain-containing protein [Burkholderiales bacterium]
MIDLHTWPTPNGRKIHIMLEETGLPYSVHPVNTRSGDQFAPAFLKISANNKIPAIVDRDGPGGKPLALFESGAILLYLAEKSGRFLPREPHTRFTTLQWLMFQMSGVGPMFGQASHFRAYSKDQHGYSIERYTNEVMRLHRVLDIRLGEAPYLAGDDYTIADIATFPWMVNGAKRGARLADYPNVKRWYEAIEIRPAVVRGMALLAEERKSLDQTPTDAEREVMFGTIQHQRNQKVSS